MFGQHRIHAIETHEEVAARRTKGALDLFDLREVDGGVLHVDRDPVEALARHEFSDGGVRDEHPAAEGAFTVSQFLLGFIHVVCLS